jgi:hypothetical protein
MKNRNLLIGTVVIVLGYLLYKKSQNKTNTIEYSKECYDSLERALQSENVKPPNFEKDFLKNCQEQKNLNNYSQSTTKLKNIIIPKGSIINNARINWNGIEFETKKENEYDYGIRNVNFGDFEILSIVDRSKEPNIPPYNQLKKDINGFKVTYNTIVNVKLNKNITNSINNAPVIYT